MKLAFYERLPQILEEKVALRPDDVFVTRTEHPRGLVLWQGRSAAPRNAGPGVARSAGGTIVGHLQGYW